MDANTKLLTANALLSALLFINEERQAISIFDRRNSPLFYDGLCGLMQDRIYRLIDIHFDPVKFDPEKALAHEEFEDLRDSLRNSFDSGIPSELGAYLEDVDCGYVLWAPEFQSLGPKAQFEVRKKVCTGDYIAPQLGKFCAAYDKKREEFLQHCIREMGKRVQELKEEQ